MHVYVCNLILYLMCMYHVYMIHFLYLENKIVTHLIYCLLNLILYCEHILIWWNIILKLKFLGISSGYSRVGYSNRFFEESKYESWIKYKKHISVKVL